MSELRRVEVERLLKIIDFLKIELSDVERYKDISFGIYENDREKRRSLERWIENIVNASLDIAKIILVAKDKEIPDTYKGYFIEMSITGLISSEMAEKLADGVKVRNILAHQYIDIKWENIKRFISDIYKVYTDFVNIGIKFGG